MQCRKKYVSISKNAKITQLHAVSTLCMDLVILNYCDGETHNFSSVKYKIVPGYNYYLILKELKTWSSNRKKNVNCACISLKLWNG